MRSRGPRILISLPFARIARSSPQISLKSSLRATWSAHPVALSSVSASLTAVLNGVHSPTMTKAMMIHPVSVMVPMSSSTVLNFLPRSHLVMAMPEVEISFGLKVNLAMTSPPRGLLAAYKEIGAHCDAVNIPKNVSDNAKFLYKQVDDAKAFKGKSQEAIIGGCIFIACRQCGVPRTFREIYALTKVSKKELGRTFKALEAFLNAESNKKANAVGGKLRKNAILRLKYIDIICEGPPVQQQDLYKSTQSTNAVDLCLRYCSQLGLKAQIFVKVSQGLASNMAQVPDLAGRSPLSIAAACIYMASHLLGKGKSPKDISLIAGVSDGTIRTAYKYLYDAREKLIDPEWLQAEIGSYLISLLCFNV